MVGGTFVTLNRLLILSVTIYCCLRWHTME